MFNKTSHSFKLNVLLNFGYLYNLKSFDPSLPTHSVKFGSECTLVYKLLIIHTHQNWFIENTSDNRQLIIEYYYENVFYV